MNINEHLLTCLNEEAVEIALDVDKALRFGLDDRNPLDRTSNTNRERIIAELNDLLGVVSLLVDSGIIPKNWESPSAQSKKVQKILSFMNYARKTGALK